MSGHSERQSEYYQSSEQEEEEFQELTLTSQDTETQDETEQEEEPSTETLRNADTQDEYNETEEEESLREQLSQYNGEEVVQIYMFQDLRDVDSDGNLVPLATTSTENDQDQTDDDRFSSANENTEEVDEPTTSKPFPSVDSIDDDGTTCPICLESWEMTGEHRLVCLQCGHLFGESCIRRWLTESERQAGAMECPQCKAKAAPQDVRHLYAKRVQAVDRTEEEKLRLALRDERLNSRALQTEIAKLQHNLDAITGHVQRLRTMQNTLETVRAEPKPKSPKALFLDSKKSPSLQKHKLFLRRSLELSNDPGSRVLKYASHCNSLVVSQASSGDEIPGFGVRFIDTPTFRFSAYLRISTKLLRDICVNAHNNLFAVTTMERHARLYDMRTRQLVSTLDCFERLPWSCAMHPKEEDHSLYLGSTDSTIYRYDLRYPESIVEEYRIEDDPTTILDVAVVCAGNPFPFGGFLVCKIHSVFFYEYTASSNLARGTRLDLDGSFMSMNFDANRGTLLITSRRCPRYPNARYIYGRLEKEGDKPVFNVKVTFTGSHSAQQSIRSAQLPVQSNALVAGYLQVEKTLSLFDVRREQRVQSVQALDIIYDMCPMHFSDNSTFVAALTDKKCRLYKLSSTD